MDLDPCDMGTQAEVGSAAAEGHVIVWSASQIELVGRGTERAGIAVGRSVVHDDLLTRGDGHATDLGVAFRSPAHVHDGAYPPKQFLDRRQKPGIEVLRQPCQLFRMGEEGVEAARDQIAGSVPSGVDEQEEKEVEVEDLELV